MECEACVASQVFRGVTQMASEKSSKSKLGTLIALLGGALGIGVVVYALMYRQETAVTGGIAPQVEAQSGRALVEAEPAVVPEADGDADISTAANAGQDDPNGSDLADRALAADVGSDTGDKADAQGVVDEVVRPLTLEVSRTVEALDPDDGEGDVQQTLGDDPPEADPVELALLAPSITDPSTGEPVADAPNVASQDPVLPAADPLALSAGIEPVAGAPELDPSDPSVPKFDLVRIEADGSAVIAGRASPNAKVQILSNGKEIGEAIASAKGEFVALVDTELTEVAQSLALVASDADGGKISSQSNVIVLARSTNDIAATEEVVSLAPAIIQSTPEAVRIIQPVVGLADLDRVSLDSISYDQDGKVIMAGRGRPGNISRVYANGTPLFDSRISAGGTWSATLSDVEEGRYVIRVDEISPSGDVLSRVESPFQRIFPSDEQLALLSDASSVIVQPGNNLWTIAEGRYGIGFRYTTIFEANKEQIRDPDLIFPGQVFALPDDLE